MDYCVGGNMCAEHSGLHSLRYSFFIRSINEFLLFPFSFLLFNSASRAVEFIHMLPIGFSCGAQMCATPVCASPPVLKGSDHQAVAVASMLPPSRLKIQGTYTYFFYTWVMVNSLFC